MKTETTRIKGIWWKPEMPDKKLTGEATYSFLTGANVDLYGLLHDPFDDTQPVQGFTLHGLTFEGQPISLFRCVVHEENSHFVSEGVVGSSSCKINSCSGIIGGHYESIDHVSFQNVYAKFTGLRDWASTSGLNMTMGKRPGSFALAYEVPQPIPLGEFGSISGRIEFSYEKQPAINSFQIEQDCILILESKQMQPYRKFAKYIHAFQSFLCLPLQRPVYCLQITGRTGAPNRGASEVPVAQDCFLIRNVSIGKWDTGRIFDRDQLFTLKELKSTPALIFKTFLDHQNQLQPSLDLYFSAIHSANEMTSVEFLTLAQAVEAYHREAMPGKYMSDESYQNGLRKKLWDAIPHPPEIDSDFRTSLKNKLNYLHEFSLQKRIKELVRKHATVLEPLLGDADTFARAISNLRNQLTHRTSSSAADYDFAKLWNLSAQLSLLLEVCFLGDMGLPHDQVKGMVANRSKNARNVRNKWVLI